MQKLHNVSKRVLTMFLTVAILLSAFSSTLAFAVAALSDEKDASKTDGQIIAENYELTEKEKELLSSGFLMGATHNYDIPDASDDLISVDIDRKEITAKSFKGADGYIWNPVQIEIIENNVVSETLTAITNNKATYTTTAAAFAVKVKYDVTHEIDEDTQRLLLNASTVLKEGLTNLDAVLGAGSKVQSALATFVELSTTTGVLPADSNNPNAATKGILQLLYDNGYTAGFATLRLKDYVTATAQKEGIKYAETVAVGTLLSQLNANGGKLNLQVLADEYAAAAYDVKFLIENAERIHAEIVKTFDCLYSLTADNSTFKNIISGLDAIGMGDKISAVEAYIASITNIVGDKTHNGTDLVVVKNGYLEPYYGKDAWRIIDENPVADGLNDSQNKALDIIALALGEGLHAAPATLKNPLVVDSTTIQYNMSMYDVTVNVKLQVVEDKVGSAGFVTYDTVTLKLTLAQNATADEIRAAIEGSHIEDAAKNKWQGVYVEGQFERTADTIPAVLTKDIEYNITFAPKFYDFTSTYGGNAKLPYGYQLLLPNHADAMQAYDYSVNGTYYAQGSVVVIMGDVDVSRTAGKSYTSYTLNNLVADNYFTGNKVAYDILTSGALKNEFGTTLVNVREPGDADNLVSIKGGALTAKKYDSSYDSRYWMPYAYTVVTDGGTETFYFNGAETVTVTAANYNRIEVVYRLTTSFDKNEIQDLIDLPALLVSEAASQIAALDKLNAYYDIMAEIESKKNIIGGLNNFIDQDEEADEATKTRLKDAITGLTTECFSGSTLKMRFLLDGYRALGLEYYYDNSAKFHQEITTLDKYLAIISQDKEILRRIAGSLMPEAVSYVDKIDTVGGAIASLKSDLKTPNEAIDLNSESLSKLVGLLTKADAASIPSYSAKDLYIESKTFTVNADDKATIIVNVQGQSAVSQTFNKDHVLTAGEVGAIIKAVEKKIAELDYSDVYYDSDYNRALLEALVGEQVGELDTTLYSFTFTLKKFTVKIDGAADATLDLDNRQITLPASNSAAVRYDYAIFGKTVSAGKYVFSDAEFEQIAKAGGYTVVRKVVDVEIENYTKLVNDLNKATASDLIVFALTENNGKYSVIMKVDLSNPTALKDAFMGLAMELVSYGYVAFDDNEMIYGTANGPMISIQALLDTVYGSGIGTDTLLSMMNANGVINNMPMPGKVISDKVIKTAGAKLAETDFVVGTDADRVELPMYITVGAVHSSFVSIRNLFADRLAPYFALECENGEIGINLTLPQKAYEAYLAVLLATDNIDITDVNAMNEQIAVGFLEDVIKPVMESNASAKSVQNTLAKFGYNIDLTGYEDAFEALRKAYNARYFHYDEIKRTYDATININIGGYLDRLGAFGSMIAEKDTGIKVPLSANLTNLDKNYEALYFDIGAAGIMNKFGLVEDISEKLGSIAGTAVVILLDDIDDSLVFNTTTVLDLNGCVVNGGIVAKGHVNVIDTAIGEGNIGGVMGSVSGNLVITGGQYKANVHSYIPTGYAQNANGVVANEFINIVEDSDGNITAKLNADALAYRELPDIKSLAIDIVAELLLNGFTTNKLYFAEQKVFDLTIEDLVGIYTAPNRAEALVQKLRSVADLDALVNLVNILLEDVTDFRAISAALNYDLAHGTETPIATHAISTGAWGIQLDYVEADDSITLDIVSNHEESANFSVVVVGDKANRQYVANLMNVLAETTTADFSFNGSVGKNGSTFLAEVALSADVRVDFSVDDKYAVMFATIIADGIGRPANRELVAGLEDYFQTQNTAALESAFNKLTINQIVTAAKNFARSDTFAGMLNNLGLGAYAHADAAKLEEDFDIIGALIGKLFVKAKIDGPAIAIGGLLDPDTNAYTMDKENLEKTFSFGPYAGYGVQIGVAVDKAFASIKFFGDGQIVEPEIDYSALKEEIAKIEAENLDKDLYTSDSWARFEATLAAARDLIGNAETQQQVDEMVLTLRYARQGLVRKGQSVVIDYSELIAEIAKIKAENLDPDKYTDESWSRFATMLAIAENTVAKANAESQADVDWILVQLRAARAGLVLKGQPIVIDYSALEAEIAKIEAENLDANKYTAETWAALEAALTAAKNLIGKANSQAEVDTALAELKAARAGLVEKEIPVEIDYSALEAEIAKIETENLDADKYTAESWAALEAALTAAKNLIGKANSQAEVDTALAELKAARQGLVEKTVTPPPATVVDYSKLEEAIERAEALDADDYTEESWKALEAALEAARAALTSKDQAVVDKAAQDLNDAIDALEKKPAPVWIWITLGSVGGAGIIAAAVTVIIRKKKKMTDSTPLVDYNIDEDNV